MKMGTMQRVGRLAGKGGRKSVSKQADVIQTRYGPIPRTEKPLLRKARLLQGYYRQEELYQPMGTGPTRTSKQLYCNMLAGGKGSGKNFLTPEIFEYAKFRCRDKRSVETIDEFRLFNNMLSSQPMCFNLFVPLRLAVRRGKPFVDKVFRRVFPHLGIDRIINLEIEYIPVPVEEYINDKTAFDAFVEYRTSDGEKGCIGIETKYVDALGKNDPRDLDRKLDVAKGLGCFTREGINLIKTECPQIVRNFLLTEKYRMSHGYDHSNSIILGLKQDIESDTEIQKLKKILRPDFQSKITKISLEDFADTIREYIPSNDIEWIENFQKRYLDMGTAERLVTTELGSTVTG